MSDRTLARPGRSSLGAGANGPLTDRRSSTQERDTMLVLTRKLMERIYIGDEICVTVVRLEGGQVRLGIEAPRQIPVVRAELRPLPGTRGEARPPEAPEVPGPTLTTPRNVPLGNGIRRRGPSQ